MAPILRGERRPAVVRGFSGMFQINGRSDKPMHLNTGDDLYCVHSCSLWLDLRILTVTPFAALGGRGVF
jgi:lipopolysaccharide/colanic/teichoic acid biosynthesis glycosyltransferase